MAHVIIDRRKNDKGKSLVNRRRFLRRVKASVKDSLKEIIEDANIEEVTSKEKKPINIKLRDLDEPSFHNSDAGTKDYVLVGNDRWLRGDRIPRQKDGEGQGRGGSPDGEGEDDFTFGLTLEEFLELFFEDLELPDLLRKEIAQIEEFEPKRAGFVKEGTPAQLNVARTMKYAKSRRSALRSLKKKKLRELEEQAEALQQEIAVREARGEDVSLEKDHLARLLDLIEATKRKVRAVPFIDPIDLRYNNWTKLPTPAVQAVMFCLMDVSGSMDQARKDLAKRFFMLMYLFLTKKYQRVEIRFIRHHTIAKEVDQEEFFYSQESGGTIVSTAIKEARRIIDQEYPLSEWNVYVAQASDGENFDHDNPHVIEEVEKMLHYVQYYAYIQVADPSEYESFFQKYFGASEAPMNLWTIFSDLARRYPHLDCGLVTTPNQIYPVFRKLFEKRTGRI